MFDGRTRAALSRSEIASFWLWASGGWASASADCPLQETGELATGRTRRAELGLVTPPEEAEAKSSLDRRFRHWNNRRLGNRRTRCARRWGRDFPRDDRRCRLGGP